MPVRTPTTVSVAVVLLVATYVEALWQMAFIAYALGAPLWMACCASLLIMAPLLALLVMVVRGRRWARAICGVLAVLSLCSIFPQLTELAATDWLVAISEVAALVLLYLPASNTWFASHHSRASSKRGATGESA